jgi:hypothetical protein
MATQSRTRRKQEPEPEPEEPEALEDEELDEDAELEDAAEEAGAGNGLNIEVNEDRVIIDLPRNGNEKPALEAIGAMLETMS